MTLRENLVHQQRSLATPRKSDIAPTVCSLAHLGIQAFKYAALTFDFKA